MANNIAVAVTADVADLTAKMAVAKATMQDVGKAMREVARDVAAGDTSTATKTRLLEVSDAYSKASNEAAIYAKQVRSSKTAANDTVVSAGMQRFALRDLASQMQDLGVGFSMAAQSSEPFKMAMMTITQQSSQVLQAIQLMRGEAGGFIGFLGGPWGAAIMAGASVLANLAAAHMSAGDAAETQAGAEVDLGKALDALRDKAVQATASIEDGIRSSINDATAKRQQAVETLKAAQAELELARAKAASANASVSAGAPGYSNMYNIGESAKQDALADAAAKRIAALQAAINSGTQAIKGFQAEITKGRVEQEFDASAAATARYSQRISDLSRAYRDDQISLDQYTTAVRDAKAAEIAAENADKGKKRTQGSGGQSSREAARQARIEAKEQAEAARDALQERIAIARLEDALAEDNARTEIALSQNALQAKLEDISAEQRAGQISGMQAIQQRTSVNQQLLILDQQLEQRLYEARLKELRDDQKNYATAKSEYRDYTRQIELLEQQHLNRMSVLKAQADAKSRAANRTLETESNRRMQGMAGTWAQNLARMATLQQGFSATVNGLWQGLVNVVSGVVEQMLEKWITAELIKIGLMKVTGASSVASEAAKAGAGGVASMAAAPFPMNLTAPAFGASMAAAASAFGIAGFAKGTNELPTDMIAQIHAGERIVPAADNAELLDLTRRGAGMGRGDQRGSGGNDSAVHLHFHGAVINGSRELKRFAEANAAQLSAAGKKYARNGGR